MVSTSSFRISIHIVILQLLRCCGDFQTKMRFTVRFLFNRIPFHNCAFTHTLLFEIIVYYYLL